MALPVDPVDGAVIALIISAVAALLHGMAQVLRALPPVIKAHRRSWMVRRAMKGQQQEFAATVLLIDAGDADLLTNPNLRLPGSIPKAEIEPGSHDGKVENLKDVDPPRLASQVPPIMAMG